jgi:hypothetical protein
MALRSPVRGWSPGRQRGRGDDLVAETTPHSRFKHSLHVFCMCVPCPPTFRQLLLRVFLSAPCSAVDRRRKLARRQLDGSQCSYADYEQRAAQLEQQRSGWDQSTQAEWRQWQLQQHEDESTWRHEILQAQTNSRAGVPRVSPGELLREVGGIEDEPQLKVQNRRRLEYGRVVEQLEIIPASEQHSSSAAKGGGGGGSPVAGQSPDASYASTSGFSLLGDSLDWLPPIQNTSSYELERSKALMEAAKEAFHPSGGVKKRPPSHDGMLLTRMHDLLCESPSLQRRLMEYLARIDTRYKWDDKRQQRRSLAPKQCTLRVISGHGLQKADAYDGSDPYVTVYWNGQMVGRTDVVHNTQSPVWGCEIPLLVPPNGHGRRALKFEMFDHDDEEGDNDPDFMGQILFDGIERRSSSRSSRGGGGRAEATTPPGGDAGGGGGGGGGDATEAASGDTVESGLPSSSPTEYTLQRDTAHDVVHHTATFSYQDPYNAKVGGTLALQLGPHGAGAQEVSQRLVNGKMVEEVVLQGSGYSEQANTLSPLDFSFWGLTTMPTSPKEMSEFEDRAAEHFILPWSLEEEELGHDWKFAVVDSVRLANNKLETIEGLPAALGRFLFMGNIRVLQHLDLSFNAIRRLDKGVLEALPNLSTLYLHTNLIEDFSHIKKLSKLKLLEKLSLQNNPVQTSALQSMAGSSKGVQEYRVRVVATCPWLKELDFSTVTSSEMQSALQHRHEVQRLNDERKRGGQSPLPSPLRTMLGREAGYRRGGRRSPTKMS